MKTVYTYNADGIYVGTITLNEGDKSPLEPDVWLIPSRCVEVAPPPISSIQFARWVNGDWVVEDIPTPTSVPVAEPIEEPAPVKFDPAAFLNLPRPAPETEQDVQTRLVAAVQKYMDTMAQGFGYDNVNSAATYAEEPAVPKFQSEGRTFRAWRSVVWARCYELFDEVQAGIRSTPDEQQLIALLPQFDIQEKE